MRFGSSDEPWFRVGNVDVNTTTFVTGLGVLSIFVWAIEGPSHSLLKWLWLNTDSVLSGQIWRLVTWPIPNDPNIWTVVMLAVFFMLGSQLEASMGRRHFTALLLSLTIVPAAVVTLYDLIGGGFGLVFGLRFVELGVLCAFALRWPNLRFWPGIPAWVIAAVIVGVNFLDYLGDRYTAGILVLVASAAVGLFATRAMGYAEEADWLPKLPVPASFGGTAAAPSRTSTSRRKRRRGNLSAVPAAGSAPRKELSKLEEAEMDAILDQVAEHGMDSLTPEQRNRLELHSRRLRRRGE